MNQKKEWSEPFILASDEVAAEGFRKAFFQGFLSCTDQTLFAVTMLLSRPLD